MASFRTTFFLRIASTCAIAMLLGLATQADGAVRVAKTGGTLRLGTAKATAEIRLARFRLRVRDREGRLFTSEANDGGPFFERAGGTNPITLGRVEDFVKTADGALLTVATGEASNTSVELRWTSERTLEVVIEPPAPETL